MMSEQNKLLKQVQMYAFVLVDAGLYLDTHPTDREALDYYNKNLKRYQEALKEYEEKFGPLSRSGIRPNATKWEWVQNTWPWENEV